MNQRYQQAFNRAIQEGAHAFIPFTVLGWPTAELCLRTIEAMIEEGATALELGVAFSDPIADGPTIQAAAFETLDQGFTVAQAFALVEAVRKGNSEIPIGLLVYYNVVLATGVEQFYRKAAAAGVDSVLIADLPPDAAQEVAPFAGKYAVAPVYIASPLTSDKRLQILAEQCQAYIYVVSRLGITGAHEKHDEALTDLLQRARRLTDLPLCVGFGISSPESAKAMIERGADGVITGSKIIDLVRTDAPPDYPVLRRFLQDMRKAVSMPLSSNI